jgi:hypothetical protein
LTCRAVARLSIAALVWAVAAVSTAQFSDGALDLDHPAIQYSTRGTTDRVAALGERVLSGQLVLPVSPTTGSLRSLLDALDVRVDSQILVFSKTSLQSNRIHPGNPRAIYFNDSVVVAWVRGGFTEIAVQDPQQGAVFYRVLPATSGPLAILRDNRCLQCHFSNSTLGVPGLLARSIPSAADGSALPWLGNYTTDHRSPLTERWAGWYVTGATGPVRHLGNAPVRDKTIQDIVVEDSNLNLADLRSRFDTTAYLSPHSDAVALLVFDHQLRMMNLLTRLNWEARAMAHEGRSAAAIAAGLHDAAREAVDYLLFVDEAPLTGVRGSSGFAESFSARGPRDSQGRTFRDFDLKERLFKYRCSYMIYAEVFEQLPNAAKQAVYARLWEILSGTERGAQYARISQTERRDIIEILRDTKKDLPAAFSPRPSRP